MSIAEMIHKNYGSLISELRESLGWMDSVFANINEGVLVVQHDMKALFANDAVGGMVGKPRIALLGTPVWEILKLTADGEPLQKNDYQKVLGQKNLDSLSGRYHLHEDQTLTVDIRVSVIPNKDQAVFIIRDVTQQVQNEQELMEERLELTREKVQREKTEENQRLLQNIIDGTSAIIFLKDLEGRYIMVNDQFEKKFGIENSEIKEKTDSEIFSAEIAEILQQNDSKVLKTKDSIRWEEDIPHESGRSTYLYLKFPLLDSTGKPHSICGILTDITARKELEKRKEDFISMASHELKTPLTSIRLMLKFTKEHINQGETEKALSNFSKFQNQIEKTTDLVDNLLDVSRMKTGKLELNPEEFDLNTLVRETIEIVQSTTDKHKIHLREDAKQQCIVADRLRIEQVLINLLTNAVKYSPDGGKIIVRIKRNADHVTVSVQDFGIGISPEHQENIFNRFYKDPTSEEGYSGLGIGLYITSQIIERHKGTKSVESKKGEGSTFVFTLPVEGLKSKK